MGAACSTPGKGDGHIQTHLTENLGRKRQFATFGFQFEDNIKNVN